MYGLEHGLIADHSSYGDVFAPMDHKMALPLEAHRLTALGHCCPHKRGSTANLSMVCCSQGRNS